MKRVYTWTAKPARRSVTVAGMRKAKGSQKWIQVTANTTEEAAAAREAGLDLIICNSINVEAVREGNKDLFLTAALGFPDYPTTDDILREAMRALGAGADAILTARSFDVVRALAKEDIPVMGHLGLVPRKSTWTDGLRAVGKSADEAFELYRKFKQLEEAGGALVEAEVIPGEVLRVISANTSVITVSLGSGPHGDVDYLFMEDICGDNEKPPRHGRSFGHLARLRREMHQHRIEALNAFCTAVRDGSFPGPEQTTGMKVEQLEQFEEKVARHRQEQN